MTVLNKINAVTSAGASQALAGDDGTGTDKVYDLTLSAACAITLSGSNTGRLQTITAILRQGGSGGFTPTFPATVLWSSGYSPSFNTKVGFLDIVQFVSVDGVNWIGALAAAAATAASLTVTPFTGTTYASQSLAVSGGYVGPIPSNIDYAFDGVTWTTASGATISGGSFSFSVTAPAAGSYPNFKVRATNAPAEVSPAQALTIAAASVPTSPTLGVTGGNAQNVLAMGATLNGSNITQFAVYRGTTAGGEGATPVATVTTGITNGATTASATYTDTGLTNGTTYYYKITATNSAGASVQSSEASATPAVPATPESIFGSALIMDLDVATLSSLANGASLSTWNDGSGAGNNATAAAAAPTYTTAGVDGKPGVLFNGTSQYLTHPLTSGPTVRTMIAVGSFANTTHNPIFANSTNSGGAEMTLYSSRAALTTQSTNVIGEANPSSLTTPNTVQTVQGSYDGANYAFVINGVAAGNGTSSLTWTAGKQGTIGYEFGSTNYFMSGEIKRLLVVNADVTSSQQTALNSYLQSTYGIA